MVRSRFAVHHPSLCVPDGGLLGDQSGSLGAPGPPSLADVRGRAFEFPRMPGAAFNIDLRRVQLVPLG